MRVLIVKLSSMGDIIHTLPALSDAAQKIPDIKFDWLVETGFSEIPKWHPNVDRVISIRLRDKNINSILDAIKRIRQQHYDVVIDAQGLLKSAIFAWIAKSKDICGPDKLSAREAVASLLYSNKVHITEKHAIEKTRQLFAKSLGYTLENLAINYGVDWSQFKGNSHLIPEQKYVVLLHGTTWNTKHWPVMHWKKLSNLLEEQGFIMLVTWANAAQKYRAQELSAYNNNIKMLPHLTINQAVEVLSNANAIVSVDTGFAHLAAALNKPIVAIYGPSNMENAATKGGKCLNLSSAMTCAPCGKKNCSLQGATIELTPCMAQTSAIKVAESLAKLECF